MKVYCSLCEDIVECVDHWHGRHFLKTVERRRKYLNRLLFEEANLRDLNVEVEMNCKEDSNMRFKMHSKLVDMYAKILFLRENFLPNEILCVEYHQLHKEIFLTETEILVWKNKGSHSGD